MSFVLSLAIGFFFWFPREDWLQERQGGKRKGRKGRDGLGGDAVAVVVARGGTLSVTS
jgi:hypothetical protein